MLNLIDQWSIEVKLLFKFTSITCIAPKVSDILNVWNKDKVQCEWSKSHVMYFSNIKKTFKTNRSIKDFQKNHQNLYKIIIPTFFFFKLQITPPPSNFHKLSTCSKDTKENVESTLKYQYQSNIETTWNFSKWRYFFNTRYGTLFQRAWKKCCSLISVAD